MASSASSTSPNNLSPLPFLPPEITLALFYARMKLAVNRLSAELEETHNSQQHRSVAVPPYQPTLIINRSHESPTVSTSVALLHAPPTIHPQPSSLFTTNSLSFRSSFMHRLHVPSIPNTGIGETYYVSPHSGLQAQGGLPPPLYHDFDIEMQRLQPFPQNYQDRVVAPVSTSATLGKTFLSLTFQAALALMVFYYQSSSSPPPPLPSPSSSHIKSLPPPLSLHIVEAAMAIGFAGSLIGILLHSAYPAMAGVFEKTGSVFAALGFFVMVGMLLPGVSVGIGWLGGIGSVMAFCAAMKKMK